MTVDSQLLGEKKKNGANQEEFVFMSVCLPACPCVIALQCKLRQWEM